MSQNESHLRVLRLLQEDPQLTQRELADRLGISLGKANYCLKALLAKGQIKIRNFTNSRNKLGYAYHLTPSGLAAKMALTAEYLRIKVAEYESLKHEIEQLRREDSAGRVEGHR
jgi:EPS-associated MarR family transcriptional regulator